jgi:hypothetical protein
MAPSAVVVMLTLSFALTKPYASVAFCRTSARQVGLPVDPNSKGSWHVLWTKSFRSNLADGVMTFEKVLLFT